MKDVKIAVIGLGYVGLPLARLFATKYAVVGFDINQQRVNALMAGKDSTLEVPSEVLNAVLVKRPTEKKGLYCATDIAAIKSCNYYIITMPTPVDKNNTPVLKHLLAASKTVARVLKKGDIVIYESTVYPGATEEDCIPVLEKESGLVFNLDFFAGYSPERINPGDKVNTIDKILKITSGSTPEIAKKVDDLYASVVTAGTYLAPSIKVAEAAKVIENTQRDLNIALINELSILFSKMNIDTQAVLEAAGSKWNFLPFKPGLVGGHCIGVDPYYLTYKAESIGYHPKVILAGRETNDSMGAHVASVLIVEMESRNIPIKGSNILVMGLTFKENCTDIRNSGTEKVIRELKKLDCNIELYDPLADREEINEIYNMHPNTKLNQNTYDGIIIATAHETFKTMGAKAIKNLCKKNHIIYDLKSLFSKEEVDLRL